MIDIAPVYPLWGAGSEDQGYVYKMSLQRKSKLIKPTHPKAFINLNPMMYINIRHMTYVYRGFPGFIIKSGY